MKIVHVTDGYLPRPGGIEHHVHDLAALQAAAGHEVTVVTTTPGPRRGDTAVATVRPPWPAAVSPSSGMKHTWVARALRAPELRGADVAHVHTSTVSPLAFGALTVLPGRGVPVVASMHSMLSHGAPVFAAIDEALGWARSPILWTAVSSAAAARLAAALGPRRPVSVLPNGVDVAAWSSAPRRRAQDHLTVVTAGRLTGRKRPGALLAMLREARRRLRSGVHLDAVVAGDGPSRSALERYLRRHGMTASVQLVGSRTRPELLDLYARADVYVAPARLESFGLAAAEAQCAGLPVIAFASSGVADFVDDGVTGLLAASDDQMVDALVGLAADPERHQALLRTTAATRPRIGWNEALERTLNAYAAAAALVGANPLASRQRR